MADRSSDIRSRANDAVHKLGELDAMVSQLEDEIDSVAEDIAHAAEPAGEPEDGAEADPIADAAEELDDGVVVNAETVDEALEKVAAEIQSDLDDAVEASTDSAARPNDEVHAPFDDNAGEDSIAAQIDEELARALDERDEDAEPVASARPPRRVEDAAESSESAQDSVEDDGAPADAQATDEAVHALAQALDRLLDDGEAAEPSDAVVEDETEVDEAGPAESAPPSAPAPAPAAKPKPKASPSPAPAPLVDTKTEQPRSLSPKSVLISALVLANKPFESLPPQVRETLGLAGLVTIFNAACLWVFLLLR
jgi:hypothetical protein